MKQRFSSLDVKVIAHELSKTLVSLRLSNVYDLSSRIFLLKFAKPDHREQLLVDSGFRCHLTSFARGTAAAPTPFVARLRKFLKTRRVTAVRQVGTDRVIELEFSDGAYRLYLEFYAGGNIVLTDKESTILALLRSVGEGAEHEQYRAGATYNLSLRQNFDGVPELSRERLRDGLQAAIQKQLIESQKPGKKIKKKAGDGLRRALAITTTEFPPILLDHALHVSGIDRDVGPEQVLESDELLDKVLAALQQANKVIDDITQVEVAIGYILAKRNGAVKEADGEATEDRGLMYEDFHPFKPAQLNADETIVFCEFSGFNNTVDEFFSSIEGQKLESKLQEREDHAKRRIEQAREEQAKRIDGLQEVQELNIRKAQAIEANVERVEEATAAVNGLIAQGMDWVDIGKLIENEQKRHNAVAELIKLPLKLHENTVTLLLSELDAADGGDDEANETDSEPDDSDDEDAAPAAKGGEDKRLTIDIDLAASGWANARQYYDQKRFAATKQEKTAQASQKALKSTEQRVMADLKKGLKQEKDVLRPVRKQFWFEKFIYFLSSDGYLVLAGKDAQQNEILYRRYLKKGDVYVNADLQGAASVIIKNNPATPEAPIPPSTLSQAGNLAVCTSSAWESKAVMSAWWVNADQVSKTAPTGEYLTNGGFVIRGKKNHLPPAQLLLGFGVMFQISEESKANHIRHRLQRTNANKSVAGSDGDDAAGSDGSDDDEFPDAPAAPANDDDDDEFPDAQQPDDAESEEESPEPDQQDADAANDDDDDDERPRIQSNPLRSGGKSGQEAEDDQDENTAGETDIDAGTDNGEPEEDAVTTVDPSAASEGAEDGPPKEGALLTNKERKALARLEKGKPIHGDPKPKPSKGQRGKKFKAKKIADKYADQDEDDRELAMKLLGPKAAEEKREAEAKAAAAKVESAEEARARRRAQHEKAQEEGLRAEEMRRLKLAEGEAGDDEDDHDADIFAQLDALVGTPLPGDEILEAIPVCAPWAALARSKYKAKLQPGQQKKGKAVREILGKWTKGMSEPKNVDNSAQDSERIWPREAELVKGWKEAEIMSVIPVKLVRVMMGGGGAGAEKRKGGKGKGGRGGRGKKR
ncbi:putative serologically defined colon cancer antigen 1 protein [Zymoseptoria brevis]|uniref:Ribosome quality control complex subunit 2 n=1 Tax=Zymoseptoria brevis TaxID=1047168 RepID=A0A0F4GA86_9PEZI|nr:putative serologically defined colon cancer antigen 1 protein [Zymoseptoria brevis]